MPTIRRDVIVIGAGWSGLLACKYMIQEGLSVVVLEKRPEIGGVWRYSDDPEILTVMKQTKCTSSSPITEISDFPMTDEMGLFPNHDQIWEYLNSYCEAFDLKRHIHLNCRVQKVEKVDDQWKVMATDGKTCISRKLVVCCGVHQKPNRELEKTLFRNYTGEITHSGNLKQFVEGHKGRRVMVFGGGETAADIIQEWHENGVGQIIWCIPRGQLFIRKYSKPVNLSFLSPQASDLKQSSRLYRNITPFAKGTPGQAYMINWSTAGSLLAYQGHGIPEWKNDAEYFHFFLNKNGYVLDLVDYEQVVPKGAVDAVDGKNVMFTDGTKAEVDVIIQCTGYTTEIPFLHEKYKAPLNNNYKFIFNVTDPSLAFVGYVRPVIGSIPLLSEVQAGFVARVFSGSVTLPGKANMVKITNKDKEFWSKYFKDTSQRLSTLVEMSTYLDDIAGQGNYLFSHWELLKENLYDWLTAVTSPACASNIMLLKSKATRKMGITRLRQHGNDGVDVVQIIFILLFRLIWFDWWLYQLGKVKYWFQTNKTCKYLKGYRFVKALDWLWTIPKRFLFDSKTRA